MTMTEDTDAALMKAGHQIEQLQKRVAELERERDAVAKKAAESIERIAELENHIETLHAERRANRRRIAELEREKVEVLHKGGALQIAEHMIEQREATAARQARAKERERCREIPVEHIERHIVWTGSAVTDVIDAYRDAIRALED